MDTSKQVLWSSVDYDNDMLFHIPRSPIYGNEYKEDAISVFHSVRTQCDMELCFFQSASHRSGVDKSNILDIAHLLLFL